MNELTIHLRPRSEVPLYEQIYQYIKKDIQNHRMKSGEKLPSTRMLCKHLEVSRSTVELAYEQLLSEGYIESRPCSGYFVAEVEGLYRLESPARRQERVTARQEGAFRYDFTPNGVDLAYFPYSVWRKLSKECLQDDRVELFGLGDAQGEYGLRTAICDYLHQARGVNCEPGQIIIGAGNDYLLMLLNTIIGNGYKVAFENPTYKRDFRLFQNLSYEVCTVDMDGQGMRVDKLAASGADIAFVMPSHQYPLGIVMPIKRRLELLSWAGESERHYIIEDDYDSEFRYKGKPIPALQGYDNAGKVIYIGTFSKSVAPAIRISYMVLPPPLLERYRQRSAFLHSTVSRINQQVLQRFMEEGHYERHLNRMRALYKGRHDALLAALKQTRVKFQITGEHAGVHLLLRFDAGHTERDLIEKAANAGVKVYGLSDYVVEREMIAQVNSMDGRGNRTEGRENCRERTEGHMEAMVRNGLDLGASPTIILGYVKMKEEEIKQAVRLLDEAWG